MEERNAAVELGDLVQKAKALHEMRNQQVQGNYEKDTPVYFSKPQRGNYDPLYDRMLFIEL